MFPSLTSHVRDILILPVTVSLLIPGLLLYSTPGQWFPLSETYYLKELGGALAIAGLLLGIQSIRLFHYRGRGTLAPWNAPRHLVIAGPYRYIRNPMIAGIFLVLIGEAFLLSRGVLLLWALLFFLLNTIWFIYKEEPDLLARFGDKYATYKKHVPRWFPRLNPYKPELKEE